MMQALQHAKEVRRRLVYPPNAVKDDGIDLARKKIEEIKTGPAEVTAKAEQPLPYKIGEPVPQYRLEYISSLLENKPLKIETIVEAVCHFYRIRKLDLLSERRTRNLVRPRQIAMYLAREMTKRSFPVIARRLGRDDHTTAMHGCQKIAMLRKVDPDLDAQIFQLQSILVALRDKSGIAP